MLKKLLMKLGYVPVVERDEALTEASNVRIAARKLSHMVEAQQAEIERMAGRYAELQAKHDKHVFEHLAQHEFLMGELAAAR